MGWWIFAAILGVLAVLLLLPLVLTVQYKDGQSAVSVRYLFIRMQLIPEKEKKVPKKKQTNKKTSESEKEPQEKKKITPEKIISITKTAAQAITPVGKAAKYLISRIKFRDVLIRLTFSKEEAADTGILYGQFIAAFSLLIQTLQHFTNFKYKEITITPQFLGEEKTEATVYLKVKVRPIVFIVLFFKVIGPFLKVFSAITTNKEGDKNERASIKRAGSDSN